MSSEFLTDENCCDPESSGHRSSLHPQSFIDSFLTIRFFPKELVVERVQGLTAHGQIAGVDLPEPARSSQSLAINGGDGG